MRRMAETIKRVLEEKGLRLFDLGITALVLVVAIVTSHATFASTNLTQTDNTTTVASPEQVSGGFNASGTATSSVVVYGAGTDADVRLGSSAGTPVSTEYTTAGAHSWTAPAGVSSVQIELWGGGGDGGDGAGGGGGAYSKTNSHSVTAGSSYAVRVGAAGEDSYFGDASTALAKGGHAGGSGGQAAQSIGDVTYSGDGGAGGGFDDFGYFGGSGGAAAGSGGASTGGAGGSGASEYDGAAGTSGQPPGGGGGGGISSPVMLGSGGGAPGQAILTYALSVYAASGVYKSYVDGGVASPRWSTFTVTKGSTASGAGAIAIKIKTSESSATPPTFNASGAACDFSISADGASGAKDLTTCTDLGAGRYLWYQATLTTADTSASPRLEEVTVALLTDATAPVITLTGNAEVALTVGDTYVDAGATATDETDGDLTASIATSGSVDTATVGTYTLTYSVSDAAGNAATPVTRTVTVAAASRSGSVSHSNSRSTRSVPETVLAPSPAAETPPAAPVAEPVAPPVVAPIEPVAPGVPSVESIEVEPIDPARTDATEENAPQAFESQGSVSAIRDAADTFVQSVIVPAQAVAEYGREVAKETAEVTAPVAAPVGLAAAATAFAGGTVPATLSMVSATLFHIGALAALYLVVAKPSLVTAGIAVLYVLVAFIRYGGMGWISRRYSRNQKIV